MLAKMSKSLGRKSRTGIPTHDAPEPAEGMATTAVLAPERSTIDGGLWTTQKYGELKEGDPRLAPSYVTGRVELRQLRGLYKLSFFDVAVRHRRKVEEDSSSEDEDVQAAFAAGKAREKKKFHLNLRVYLSKKNTKKRMADIEETGFHLKHDIGESSYVCVDQKTLGDFELSLKDVKDPMDYKGIVIGKGAMEYPVSDEPVVFAFVRFIDDRPALPSTETALGLVANQDIMDRMAAAKSTSQKGLKSIKFYSRNARRAWEDLGKVEEAQMNYTEFKRALDLLEITVLEPRALRLFSNCDLDKSGEVGITEFEFALMMNDAAKDYGMNALNAFYMFDIDQSGNIGMIEFKQCLKALNAYPKGKAKDGRTEEEDADHQAEEIFRKNDKDKSGEMSFDEFKKVWVKCVDSAYELTKRGDKNVMPVGKVMGRVARKVNEARLLDLIQGEEKQEMDDMNSVYERVNQIRIKKRNRQDERRREKEAAKSKQGLSSAKDTALRNKERRKQLQLEQKERAKRRNEEKLMKNKLAQEQAASKQRTMMQMKVDRVKKEKERLTAIRELGLDRLDESYKGYREVPKELYDGKDAQEKLSDLVIFTMSNNKLDQLPEMGMLYWLTSLRWFDLSQNRLLSLPKEMENLGKLQMLVLENNSLRQLPPQVEHLTSLQSLNLAHNNLTTLPPEFGALVLLEDLYLHSNLLLTLPDSFGSLMALRRLDMRGNKLKALPEEFSELYCLTELNACANNLKFLPEQMGELCKLENLNLAKNHITALPDSVSMLGALKKLRLDENDLRVLGDYVSGWTALVDLDVGHNDIKFISPQVGELCALKKMCLRSNRVSSLPPEVGLVTELESFDLAYNELTALPVELGALSFLSALNLSHNHISGRVPDQLGLLRSLTALDLSHNTIDELPDAISGLEEILELNVGFNYLAAMPEGLKYCTRLERLNVASNHISRMPSHLGGCKSLRELDLSSNMIEYLPEDMRGLKKISRIFITKNRIRALPLDMANIFDSVQEINMDRNPLTDLPPKWNERFSLREQYLRPSGYSEEQASEWVHYQKYFYEHAMVEWAETGAFHFSGRSSLANFSRAVRMRCGASWIPELEPLLKAFYFRAKETGAPPTYHLLTDDEIDERARLAAVAEAKRDDMVAFVREAHGAEVERVENLYHADLDKRTRRAEVLIEMRSQRMKIKNDISAATLQAEVARRMQLQDQRAARITQQRKRADALEMGRMTGHLKSTIGDAPDGLYFPPSYPI